MSFNIFIGVEYIKCLFYVYTAEVYISQLESLTIPSDTEVLLINSIQSFVHYSYTTISNEELLNVSSGKCFLYAMLLIYLLKSSTTYWCVIRRGEARALSLSSYLSYLYLSSFSSISLSPLSIFLSFSSLLDTHVKSDFYCSSRELIFITLHCIHPFISFIHMIRMAVNYMFGNTPLSSTL